MRVNGELVADTRAALTACRRSTYPVVQYIPIGDVDPKVLSRSDTTPTAPTRARPATIMSPSDGTTVEDAIWTYDEPYPAVAAIAGHVAFYPTKADISRRAGLTGARSSARWCSQARPARD